MSIEWNEVIRCLQTPDLEPLAGALEAAWTHSRGAPLVICLAGETKAGKSTLAERLLGPAAQGCLPRDVLEATARPILVRPADRTCRLVLGPEECTEVENNEDWFDLVRGLEPLPPGTSLEVGLDSQLLRDWGAILVDTPGGNTATPGLVDRAWAACRGANLILYTIPATAIGRRTDLDFLTSLRSVAGNVLIVLTQVDRALSLAIGDPKVQFLVDEMKAKMEFGGVNALGVLATTCNVLDDRQAGITALRETITSATSLRRQDLIDANLRLDQEPRLRTALGEVNLKVSLRVRDRDHGLQEALDILNNTSKKIALRQETFDVAAGRIRLQCDTARLKTLNEVTDIGIGVTRDAVEGINRCSTMPDLDGFCQGGLRALFDAFRESCMDLAKGQLTQLNADARDAAIGLLCEKMGLLDLDAAIAPHLRAATDPSDSLELPMDLKELEDQRQDLLEEIRGLERNDGIDELLASLEEALAGVRAERERMQYVPENIDIVLDQGKEGYKEFGRMMGKALDLAMTLAPVPVKGKLALKLAKIPGGQKALKGLKKYNDLVLARDKTLRKLVKNLPKLPKGQLKKLPLPLQGPVTHPVARDWIGKLLNNLTLETWGERLGEKLGNLVAPDKVVQIEDAATRRMFYESVKPLDDEILALQIRIEQVRRKAKESLALKESRDLTQHLEVDLERTKRYRQHAVEADAALVLLQRKRALVEGIAWQLQTRQEGSLLQVVRATVESAFNQANSDLVQGLYKDFRTDLDHLHREIAQIRQERDTSQKEAAVILSNLELTRAALMKAIALIEADE